MSKRKISNPKMMELAWEAFKLECDNQTALTHEFSAKNSEFVSKDLRRSITYTIEGFCIYIGVSRAAFYKNYAENSKFIDIVTRVKEECEVDARKKFELQLIPPQLAPLWMSKHGYSAKSKEELEPIEIVFKKAGDKDETS